MRSLTQNPFPARARLSGDQMISGTCGEKCSIRLVTGNLKFSVGLIRVPTVGFPLEFALTYNAHDAAHASEAGIAAARGVLGPGWQHNYMMRLSFKTDSGSYPPPPTTGGQPFKASLVGPDGRRYGFEGTRSPAESRMSWQIASKSHFIPATLVDPPDDAPPEQPKEFTLQYPEGHRYVLQLLQLGAPEFVARLKSMTDRNGNTLQLTWDDDSLLLREIRESSAAGRTITLDYSGGRLSEVKDPKGNAWTFAYTGGRLSHITGPDGCMLHYGYNDNGLLSSRTDAVGNTLFFNYDLALAEQPRLRRVCNRDLLQDWPLKRTDLAPKLGPTDACLDYEYDEVEEDMGDPGFAHDPDDEHVPPGVYRYPLKRTVLTDARGKKWEYRFDQSNNLWRIIDPLKRHVRNYWDENHKLLYSTAGYPPADTNRCLADNLNNQAFWRYAYDHRGDLVQAIDPSGAIHMFTYDQEGRRRLERAFPYIGHAGVQGNWRSHFGQDGIILCAFDGTSDRADIPALELVPSEPVPQENFVPIPKYSVAPGQFPYRLLRHDRTRDLIEPRVPVSPDGYDRRIGFWAPADEAAGRFSFTVRSALEGVEQFNLSLYFHSADIMVNSAPEPNHSNYYPLTLHEQSGRDLEITIDDLEFDGTPRHRKFRVYSDAAGIWLSIPVRRKLSSGSPADITVTVAAAGLNKEARLAAVAFDPLSDRTVRLWHDETSGNLLSVRNGQGHVTSMAYDPADGVLETVTDPRGRSVTELLYGLHQDQARNVTGVEVKDIDGPLTMRKSFLRYDLNGNVERAWTGDAPEEEKHLTVIAYDPRNRPTEIRTRTPDPRDPATLIDAITRIGYDGAGNLSCLTDPEGRRTTFAYQGFNRLARVSLPRTDTGAAPCAQAQDDLENATVRFVSYEWDVAGNLLEVQDHREARVRTTTMVYDDAGQLIRVQMPKPGAEPPDPQQPTAQVEVWMAYDALGRLVSVTTPYGTGTVEGLNLQGVYNLLPNPGAEEPDPYHVDDATNGSTWARFWNRSDSFTREPHPDQGSPDAPAGMWSMRHIGGQGANEEPGLADIRVTPGVPLLAEASVRLGTYGAAALYLRHLNLAGQSVSDRAEVIPEGNLPPTRWYRVRNRFLTQGDPQTDLVSLRMGAEQDGANYVYWDDVALYPLGTGYRYDPSGRLAQVVLPSGARYDMRYDLYGNLAETEDAEGRITRFFYDSLDRLVRVVDPEGNEAKLEYDSAGNLTRFHEPRPVGDWSPSTGYRFDDLGRLEAIDYPSGGGLVGDIGPSSETFQYDQDGALQVYRDNEDQAFTFAYDEARRLESIQYPEAGGTVRFRYDLAGNPLERIERNGDTATMQWNERNLLVSDRMEPGPGSSTPAWHHEHVYDDRSNRIALKSGGGGAVYDDEEEPLTLYDEAVYSTEPTTIWSVPDGGYDPQGRLLEFQVDGQSTRMRYDSEGRRTRIEYPNGVVTDAGYDFLGRLKSLYTTRTQDGSKVLTIDYGYDANSNRVAMRVDADRHEYLLDENDRLIGESINCWVQRTAREFRRGQADGTDTASAPGRVRLLGWNDALDGATINADRWRCAFANSNATGMDIRPGDGGLNFTFPRGYTHLVVAHLPPPAARPPYFGLTGGRFWSSAEHRLPLVGSFTLEVRFENFDAHAHVENTNALFRAGLLIQDRPAEGNPTYRIGAFRARSFNQDGWHGEIRQGSTTSRLSGWPAAAGSRAGWLRITRTVMGPTSALVQATFQPDGGVETPLFVDANGIRQDQSFTPGPLFVQLYIDADDALGTVRFRQFKRTSGNQFLTDSDRAALGGYGAACYVSPVFDTGEHTEKDVCPEGSVTTWTELYWEEDEPTRRVQFQVATSNDPDELQANPAWLGPGGTPTFVAPGPITGAGGTPLKGRYVRYRALMRSDDGMSTPLLSLVRLCFSAPDSLPWNDRRYAFDARGNMNGKQVFTAEKSTTEARSINDLNQIRKNEVVEVDHLNSTTTERTWHYRWDRNGNLEARYNGPVEASSPEAWRYEWSADNRLVQVTQTKAGGPAPELQVAYVYDSVGRLLSRTAHFANSRSVSDFEWDFWDMVHAKDPASNFTIRVASVNGETFQVERQGLRSQVHADAIGNVLAETMPDGNKVGYRRDAWGHALVDGDEETNGFLLAHGSIYDETVQMHYLRYRFYDSNLCQFVSRDPLAKPGRDISFNYQYASGNPASHADPMGLFTIDASLYAKCPLLKEAILSLQQDLMNPDVKNSIAALGLSVEEYLKYMTDENKCVRLRTGGSGRRLVQNPDGSQEERIQYGETLSFDDDHGHLLSIVTIYDEACADLNRLKSTLMHELTHHLIFVLRQKLSEANYDMFGAGALDRLKASLERLGLDVPHPPRIYKLISGPGGLWPVPPYDDQSDKKKNPPRPRGLNMRPNDNCCDQLERL